MWLHGEKRNNRGNLIFGKVKRCQRGQPGKRRNIGYGIAAQGKLLQIHSGFQPGQIGNSFPGKIQRRQIRHGINGFITSLYWLINGLTVDNARCDNFDWREAIVLNRTFTVDWRTQGVNYTTQQATANRYFQNTASTLNLHGVDVDRPEGGRGVMRIHQRECTQVQLKVIQMVTYVILRRHIF